MALTLRRWVLIAVLTCAAVAIWWLPPHGDGTPVHRRGFTGRFVAGHGYVRPYGWPDASAKLGAATLHLRLLELRDSVFTPRVLAGADSGLTVSIDRQIPDPARALLESVLRGAWRYARPGHRIPVLLAVVQDTTVTLGGLPMGGDNYGYAHIFPPDSAARACRILVRGHFTFAKQSAKSLNLFARRMVLSSSSYGLSGGTILGPCMVYASFGVPGAGILPWLSNTNWRAAESVNMHQNSPAWRNLYVDLYGWRYPRSQAFGESDLSWEIRTRLSDDGIACISGARERCLAGLLTPGAAMPADREWHQHVIDTEDMWGTWGWGAQSTGTLGPASSWVLSDMIRDLGPERFAKFWRSSDPPAAAFAAAAGEPLDDWLYRWATRAYGRDVLGPSLAERGVVAGVAALILALAAAMGFARERRVA